MSGNAAAQQPSKNSQLRGVSRQRSGRPVLVPLDWCSRVNCAPGGQFVP